MRNYFKNQKGASTIIESTIILPLVFVSIFVIIMIGYYQLEMATLHTRADRIVEYASRIVSTPDYEYYGDFDTNKIDFEVMPTINKETLKKIYSDLDPYRYWGNGQSAISKKVKSSLKKTMESQAYMDLSSSVITLKSIKAEKAGLSNKVTVTVGSEIEMPSFVKLLGLSTDVDAEFQTVAYVSDSSEFIRNTNLIFDLATYLDEKCNISNNLNDLIYKIKSQFDFINVSN